MTVEPAAQFRFCPRCAAPARPGGSARFTCGSCGFDYFFNPAAAVAAFVFDAQDRVLLIRRARDPGRGQLAPPGGFVDFGERAEVAIQREVLEETGLELTELAFLVTQPNTYHYGGTTYSVLDIFFTAQTGAAPAVAASGEVTEIVWRPVAGVASDELAFPSMQAAWREWLSRRQLPEREAPGLGRAQR